MHIICFYNTTYNFKTKGAYSLRSVVKRDAFQLTKMRLVLQLTLRF